MTEPRQAFTVPFTGGEMQLLFMWQRDPRRHPLTCNGGQHWRDHVHDHEVILEPTVDGLVCPECGRVQTWVPR